MSYIPKDSAVARCVRLAMDCYKRKVDFAEARKLLHNEAPGAAGTTAQFELRVGLLNPDEAEKMSSKIEAIKNSGSMGGALINIVF